MPDLEQVCIGCVGRETTGFSGARAVEAVGEFGKDEDVGEIVFGLGLGIVGLGGCIVGSRVGSGMFSGKGGPRQGRSGRPP